MKNVKKVIGWALVAALALLLAVLPSLVRSRADSGDAYRILSARAELGEITTTTAGAGTLKAQDAVEVEAPNGVEIAEYRVSNGDLIREGDGIAAVESVSLMAAITEMQEALDTLADQLSRAAGTAAEETLTAKAGGRVKAVYVREGDNVRDALLAHGCLALISMDGRMAVEFSTTDALPLGQSVTVTLSGGASYTGYVESSMEGKTLVTLTDEGPRLGDTATVTDARGAVLGGGTLSVHSPWRLLATDGTVSYVHIREEQTVSQNTSLVTIEEIGHSAEYDALAARRREYSELLRKLLILAEDGILKAPCDGFVSGVDKNRATGAVSTTSDGLFSLDGTVIAAVTPSDTMTVSISVDELDILQFALGMEADITVDALPGESYTGTVTRLGGVGSNSGGSSKFSVELTLKRAGDMLEGMNASVVVRKDTTTSLRIPTAALHDSGSKSYVYTGYDERSESFTDPVQVETGDSDGEYAAVLSGLSEGQTVWYSWYGGIDKPHDAE